jgi:hypothetical protein
MENCHELGQSRSSEECIVCHFKSGYLKLHVLGAILFLGPEEGYEENDLIDGVATAPSTTPWKGALLGCSADLGRPIWSNVFRKMMFRELPLSTSTQLSFTSLIIRLTICNTMCYENPNYLS